MAYVFFELCRKYQIEKEKIKKENEFAISSCLNKVDSDGFTVQYINDDVGEILALVVTMKLFLITIHFVILLLLYIINDVA